MKMRGLIGVLASACACVCGPAQADIELRQPIDCTLGETCVIQQYMDHDPSIGVRDYQCGSATYDGHKGTDFRISVEDTQKGVNVLAAADGVILGLRDGMADKRAGSQADLDAVDGKECGNGVVLRHADGWETQYCHLKKGSVVGKKGTRVKAGDVLGQVGLSGRTQFPHLHLSVRKDGVPIDPFSAGFAPATCGKGLDVSLWQKTYEQRFKYAPTQIVESGIADRGPSLAEVMDGVWDQVTPRRDAPLVVYGMAVNGKAGDQVVLRLEGPNGVIVNNKRPPLEKRKAQWFGFAGKRAPDDGWPKGAYKTVVEVWRDGETLRQMIEVFEVN